MNTYMHISMILILLLLLQMIIVIMIVIMIVTITMILTHTHIRKSIPGVAPEGQRGRQEADRLGRGAPAPFSGSHSQNVADFYFNAETQDSLQNIADPYFNVDKRACNISRSFIPTLNHNKQTSALDVLPQIPCRVRGNHLSNTTCLTQAFFRRGERCGKLRWSLTRRKTHETNEVVFVK